MVRGLGAVAGQRRGQGDRHLDPGTARAFRLLGLHPGPDFEPYAAAALTGTTVRHARELLDGLARAHLIQPAGRGITACMTCSAPTPQARAHAGLAGCYRAAGDADQARYHGQRAAEVRAQLAAADEAR